MSRDRPSRSDIDLADRLRLEAGLEVSPTQIRRWANAGLIPHSPGRPGPGRGRSYPVEVERAAEVAELIVDQRHTLDEATVILFARGRNLPDSQVRAAYRNLLTEARALAEEAVDPLLDDPSPHGAPARWNRSFAQTVRGRLWRERLKGAPAEWEGGEPVERPARPDRMRTIHPGKALREVLTAMIEHMTGNEPSEDAQRLLHRALGLEDLSLAQILESTASLDEMIGVVDVVPLESLRTAIDWVRSLDGLARLLNLTDLSELVADIEPVIQDELEMAIGAVEIVAVWRPDYQPPNVIGISIALVRLADAAGPELLPYLLEDGAKRLAGLSLVEHSRIQIAISELAANHPEEVDALESSDR